MIRPSPSSVGLGKTAVSAALSATAAVVVGLGVGSGQGVDAAGWTTPGDLDGDGISNLAESVRLTDPASADTDGDGFGDLEELARGMNPRLPDFVGPAAERAVGLSAVGDGAWVRTQVALYLEDGDFSDLDLRVGAFVFDGGQPVQVELPPSLSYANGTVALVQGAAPGSLVVHFNVAIPQALYETFGWVGLYATGGPLGAAPTFAGAQTIQYEGDVLMAIELQQGVPVFSAAPQAGGVTATPIEPESQIPATLSPDQLCYQTASEVGTSGGLLELQVDTASCVDADFLFCSANCSSSVGSSRTVVDPLALIGG